MATDEKSPCGCGHPVSDHMKPIKASMAKGLKIRPCVHFTPTPGGSRLASVCGCSNYKPAMTTEQRFKNIGYEMLLAYDENIEALTAAQLVEEAWEKFSK